MGKIVERKKKKKGRPSLLDLQKRNLKEQQQQQQQHQQLQRQQQKLKQHRNAPNNSTPHSSHNYNSATPTPPAPPRRSTRRHPTASSSPEQPNNEDADDAESEGKRREKKLKLVLKLPSSSQKSDHNSSDSEGGDDEDTVSNQKKRKIKAISGGSELGDGEKGEKFSSATNVESTDQDSGPSTPLPDEKLLVFVLDRLQKKDTYGVFSEPVDLKELPDYLEVVEHPMDFGTVRKKLSSGSYANLEQFEKDVFLICSNGMQYNAPDTIYFRQARSIQELAKKSFENLRQDSDDNEPEPKVARRGRPPTKNLKKPLGRPPLDRAGSEFSSDATLASGGENTMWAKNDLRKGPQLAEKPGTADSSRRFHGSRNDANCLTDNKFDRSDEGSIMKGNSMKHAKKLFALDECRRNTYKQFHPSAVGGGPSVMTTFEAGRKELMAVGLLSEHGYARSLARFAANIGAVTWEIASKRIERSLPPGVKFGPGWVGENDIPHQSLLLSSLTFPEKQLASITSASEKRITNPLPSSASMSTFSMATGQSKPQTESAGLLEGLNSNAVDAGNGGASVTRSSLPFQNHSNTGIRPGMNGVNSTYGFSLPSQMGKLTGAARPAGLNYQSSQMVDSATRVSSNLAHSTISETLGSERQKLGDNSSTINLSCALPNSNVAVKAPSSMLEPQPSWQGLSRQPKQDSALSSQQKSHSVFPPDLNVRFQSSGSPRASRVGSTQQDDLALQL